MTVRVNRKTARLLDALLAVHTMQRHVDPAFRMVNRKLMEEARLSVQSFYTLIRRLEGNGWVEGEIEVLPEGAHRPRHTYFHLTEQGVTRARQALTERNRRWYRRSRKGTNT